MVNKIRIIYLAGLLIICYLIIHPANAYTQSTWAHVYGSSTSYEGAEFIHETSDGGYIVAGGAFFGAGNYDMWILKLDASGNVIWQKTYGGSSDDYANSIQQTSDEGYIVAGYTGIMLPPEISDMWILKLDSFGNVVWQKTYSESDGGWASSIQQTSDGGYIVAGGTGYIGTGNYDMWILKLDESGNVAWQKTYGGSSDDYANSIQQTSDGGYIVAGDTESFGAGGYDMWILKLDASGKVIWQKTYGGSSDDYANSIQQTSDGGYIVAGGTASYGAGYFDFWILKLDLSGNVIWQKTYGGSGYDNANSIEQSSDGGYIVAGGIGSYGAGYSDFWVLKLDANGTIDSSCSFINNTSISPVNSSATSAITNASISSPSIIITNTGITGMYSTATDMLICSSCTIPVGLTNNTAIDLKPCMNEGVHIGWNADPANWGDGGAGTRTYDVIRDGSAIAIGLPHGTTAYIDTSGTHGKTYLYEVRYKNGCGSGATTTGVQAADYPGPPTTMNTIVHDKSAKFDTGVDISWPPPSDWSDNGVNAVHRRFRVYRDSTNLSELLPASILTYEDTDGINNTYYTYHVDAINGCGVTTSYNSTAGIDAVTQVMDWAHVYRRSPGIDANSIQQTSDGGYIVAGNTESFGAGGYDMWILKLDSSGNVTWQKTYGGSDYDLANSIQQTSDGGYIVAGNTESFGAGGGDIWILKLDASGNVVWQKAYGGSVYEEARSIQQTSDGGYIVAGFTSSFGAGGYDMWILKLESSGNVTWQKTYGGSDYDLANSIQQTSDGGYIVAGYTGIFLQPAKGIISDMWILKLDASGNVVWQKTYGGTCDDLANSIQQTSDGGYIIAGYTESYGKGYYDMWILKLDASGNVIWQKTYGGSDYDLANSIQQTSDGGYVVAGRTRSFGARVNNIWILKLDSFGNVIWQRAYGETFNDLANAIQQTSDGGYIVAGSNGPFGTSYEGIWVLKLNPYGTMNSSCDFINDTYIIPVDSTASAVNTSATGVSTSCSVSDTNITGVSYIASNLLLCASELFLKPYNNEKPVVNDTGSPRANGIIEPGELVELDGILENTGSTGAVSVTGLLTSTDPIVIFYPDSVYPDILSGDHQTCTSCYSLIAPLGNKPATHWDFEVTEKVSAMNFGPQAYHYIYHVGESFSDVPLSYLFYPYIEKILHSGVTSGCTDCTYCPANNVLREQIAKFICASMQSSHPGSCTTPNCSGIFSDVKSSNQFCPFVEQLYNKGIVAGCQAAPLSYCPDAAIQRDAIAKLVCLGMQSANPGSCITASCTGIFSDVPPSNPFCPYIEALYNAGIISGCGTNTYCPVSFVSRGQMAKFLANGFGFEL